MKNYDIIMQQMTPERMAEMRVRLVSVNNREFYYMTSSGQLYTMDDYESAVQHEYNWLTFDPQPTSAPEGTNKAEEDIETNE